MKTTSVCLFIALAAFARIAQGNDAPTNTNGTGGDVAVARTWPVDASKVPAKKSKENGVPNFGMLNDVLWRSGQPTREGFQRLIETRKLQTVINLRQESNEDKDLLPKDFNYVYLPIPDEHAPTDEQARKFMEIVNDSKNWPILVHCHGGEGRAGVMAALVRYTKDGWDHKAIMKEVSSFRTKHLGFITTPMAGSQQTFIKHWEETSGAVAQAKPTVGS